MPLIDVYVRTGTSQEYRRALAHGIQQAMIETLGIPEDDYFQVTHQLDADDMVFDRHYFGVERGERPVFVRLSFNSRAAVTKQALFEAIARELATSPGVPREDLYMTIIETAPENWWASGRTIDARTGSDSRMTTTADR